MVIDSSFDEESYLSRYADVRSAVKAGVFSSGRAHYQAFGRAEGRDGSPEKKGGYGVSEGSPLFRYISPLDLVDDPSADLTLVIEAEGSTSIDQRRRPGAAFVDDPDATGLFSRAGETAVVPHTAAFTVTASRVRQVGYRSYLSQNGLLFNDQALVDEAERRRFVARLGQATAFENEVTGLTPCELPNLFRLETRDREVQHLQGEVVSLCSFEPTNYGAFLMRVLPKVAGRRHLLNNRKVVGPLYNKSMRELYAISSIPVERLLGHNTSVIYDYDRAIILSDRNPHFLADTETLAFYADLRNQYGTRRRGKKIFVSRLGWTGSYASTHRVMRNEEEVAARLKAEGFELVLPHAMSVKQQIEAFSSADFIVGASSSAMFNVVFSHPGTRLIDIESEPHWVFGHQNLFGSFGLDYGIFAARAQDQDWSRPHKPFSVNVDALMARVAATS